MVCAWRVHGVCMARAWRVRGTWPNNLLDICFMSPKFDVINQFENNLTVQSKDGFDFAGVPGRELPERVCRV